MKIPDDDDLIAALVSTLGITTATHGAILENLDRRWPYHGEHPGGRVGKVVYQLQEMREHHESWKKSRSFIPWVFFYSPPLATAEMLATQPMTGPSEHFFPMRMKFRTLREPWSPEPITDRDPGDEQP